MINTDPETLKKLDNILATMGWIKPFEDVPLFISKEKEGRHRLIFPVDKSYYYLTMPMVMESKKELDRIIGWAFSHSIETTAEITPGIPEMLASDYFAHNHDLKNKLKWAKLACAANPKFDLDKNFNIHYNYHQSTKYV